MSYPPSPPYGATPPPLPGQAPRPPRPMTVTLAATALLGEVALFVIGAIVSVLSSDTVKKASDDYAAAHNTSSANFGASQAFGIFIGVIYAVIMVGLALGILRGLNVVRIIAWVVCGLSICCVGLSSISSVVFLSDYLPGAYLAYLYLVSFLELVGFIAAIVLLALRPSNAFFNPQSQQQPF